MLAAASSTCWWLTIAFLAVLVLALILAGPLDDDDRPRGWNDE